MTFFVSPLIVRSVGYSSVTSWLPRPEAANADFARETSCEIIEKPFEFSKLRATIDRILYWSPCR